MDASVAQRQNLARLEVEHLIARLRNIRPMSGSAISLARRAAHLVLISLITMGLWVLSGCSRTEAEQPGLVLLIVVDQLRGDVFERYGERLDGDGLRLLVDNGVHYREAHFRHGITNTAPSHVTIVSGAHPAVHGIVGNNWIDPETNRTVYCVEDARHRLLEEPTRNGDGVSPGLVTVETLGDVIVEHGDGVSRAFGVSLKDRGAILLAGRAGKAFWYSRRSGRFVTSDYYYPRQPRWLDEFNAAEPAEAYRRRPWRLLRDDRDYRFIDQDDQPWERDYKGLGRVFPHDLAASSDYPAALRFTPYADELTLAAVAELMEAESIGEGPGPDLLAISLSATDYVGHAFGPDSLEAEDNLFRLDRTISALLALIDKRVGLARTLVILTSDHGIPSAPEYLALHGDPVARIDTPAMVARLNAALRAEFGLDYDPVLRFLNPTLFLDVRRLQADDIDIGQMARTLVRFALAEPGIQSAFASADLVPGLDAEPPERALARASIQPGRAGQVYLVQSPGWHLHPNPQQHAAMHGSPHRYDTHVPIVIMGPDLDPQVVTRPVGVESLAASVAAYLQMRAPAQASEVLLPELILSKQR